MTFDDLLNKVKSDNPITIIIKNRARKTVFVASYYTEHYPDEEYFKIFFSDGTILEIMPKTEDLYFCDDKRRIIDRDLITDFDEYLNIDSKQYLLVSSEDKQFLRKIYYGNIEDGEGGCVFSDYGFADEIWSLAVLDDGEISDVHVKKISLKDVEI
ncbi:hypothetical protein J6V85_01325 [Candidatus Saccharibacteria bacterium]|nr:hypothetical protein [Candidatus Saccharibacteria bacterium]